jgi:hypothetical protein
MQSLDGEMIRIVDAQNNEMFMSPSHVIAVVIPSLLAPGNGRATVRLMGGIALEVSREAATEILLQLQPISNQST